MESRGTCSYIGSRHFSLACDANSWSKKTTFMRGGRSHLKLGVTYTLVNTSLRICSMDPRRIYAIDYTSHRKER